MRRASVGSADSKEAEHWQFLGGSRDGVRVLASGSGQAPEAGAERDSGCRAEQGHISQGNVSD